MSGSRTQKLCGCGKPTGRHGIAKDGAILYKSACNSCRYIARMHKKEKCEKCGAIGKLEVDHIDGNRSNNHSDNLQTLCKKCHIIKTKENKDHLRYEKMYAM